MSLAVLGAVGLLRNRFFATGLLSLLVIALFWNKGLLPLFGLPAEGWMLPMFFCLGAILSINKDVIDIDGGVVFGLFLAAFLGRRTQFYPVVMPLAIFVLALYLSSLPVVRKIRLPGDFSYGIYLYGFLVQQMSKAMFPEQGVHANQLVGFLGALMLGVFSWFIVESPSIRLGKKLREWRSTALVTRPLVP